MKKNKFICIIGIVFMLGAGLFPHNVVLAKDNTISAPAHYYVLRPNCIRPAGNEHIDDSNYVLIGEGTVSSSAYVVNNILQVFPQLDIIPDKSDIDFDGKIVKADSYSIVWYRTMIEDSGWRVEGYVVPNTPKDIIINFFVDSFIVKTIYKKQGYILTEQNIPNELDYTDDTGSWLFSGWYTDQACRKNKADLTMPIYEQTEFYGAYRDADGSPKLYVSKEWVAPATADEAVDTDVINSICFIIITLTGFWFGKYFADESNSKK